MHKQQADTQTKSKEWYDKKAEVKEYKESDLMLILMPQAGKPLSIKYVGPY